MIRHVTLALALLAGTLAGAADINLSVDNATPDLNTTIAVTIRANIPAGESFVSANQFLSFDPAKLQLTAQSAGSAGVFVPDSRGLAAINASGEVRAGAYVASGGNPISGNLVMGVFRFRTVSAGTTLVRTAAHDAIAAPFGNLFYRRAGALVIPSTPGPLTITIGGGSSNNPPVIDSPAWADANPVTLPTGTRVHVVASDPDGDALSYAWILSSGPAAPDFSTPAAADSGVSFPAAGVYVLRVNVSDGKGGAVFSEVSVLVKSIPGDVNGDGVVTALDLQLVIVNFGKAVSDPGCDARADANGDGVVTALDLQIVIVHFGTSVH